MIVPVALILFAALLGSLSLALGIGDLGLLAAIIAGGAAVLFMWRLSRLRANRPGAARWIVVDGSNVLHWDGNEPRIATLRAVIATLESQGYAPVVWFDANVGYKLGDSYAGPERMARETGLPKDRVHVVPRGEAADPALLSGAARLGARVVSNDRFRDWDATRPDMDLGKILVRGSVRDGVVSLRF